MSGPVVLQPAIEPGNRLTVPLQAVSRFENEVPLVREGEQPERSVRKYRLRLSRNQRPFQSFAVSSATSRVGAPFRARSSNHR